MAGLVGESGWEGLVLPRGELRTLAAIVEQAGHCATRRGHATAGPNLALFAGSDGARKTLAAELLARRLGRGLRRIDLRASVSKYIGETEKNLRRAFAGAEAGGAVLLFDEAEALFGKRSEVKDSHDRHANAEANFLLRQIETFGGLVILATNRRADIDEAFLRRLRFVVQFDGPPPRH